MAFMTHYIITRFNLPLNYRVKGAFGRLPGLDPEYLSGRFDIFERYTIPSIEAQTCKDWKWLVFFDERTPEPFRERIEGYGKYPWFEAVFDGDGFSLKEYIDDLIEKARESGIDDILTTRLDNDDALAPDFAETLQKCALQVFPADRYLTSPTYYQYDEKAQILITKRLKKNHFISRTANVFEGSQMDFPLDPAAYVRIPGKHAVEVIHGTNVINSARFSPGCVLGRDEYERIRDEMGLKLMAYDDYRSYSSERMRQDIPVYIKQEFNRIPQIIKKAMKK